jgi:hypothetical protein
MGLEESLLENPVKPLLKEVNSRNYLVCYIFFNLLGVKEGILNLYSKRNNMIQES